MKILITGGNGFIGSHLTGALARRKISTRILCRTEKFKFADCLPRNWQETTELARGDINDFSLLQDILSGVDVVFHKASSVGIGASGKDTRTYVQTNIGGTAGLVDALRNSNHHVKKIILDSSVGVYGEGLYICKACGTVKPAIRFKLEPNASGEVTRWDPSCPSCGGDIQPTDTPENIDLQGDSVYAITKKAQEDLLSNFCNRNGISLSIMRYSSVYGPGQSEANYCAEMMRKLIAGESPSLTEDGLQSRDYVHVTDVVESNLLAMDSQNEGVFHFNVVSGHHTSLLDFATRVSLAVGKSTGKEAPKPVVTGRFNPGDVRHCLADGSKAKQLLGFQAKTTVDAGIEGLAQLLAAPKPA